MNTRPPAAPETEASAFTASDLASLTAAHRDSHPMGNIHHGTPERPDWGTFCVECAQSWPCDVSRLLERVRVVEGERDAARAELRAESRRADKAVQRANHYEGQFRTREREPDYRARAESAEAAHAALVAAVEALRLDLNADADYRVTKGSIGHRLRALLAGGAR